MTMNQSSDQGRIPKSFDEMLNTAGLNYSADSVIENLGRAFSTGIVQKEPEKPKGGAVYPSDDEVCYVCDRDLSDPKNRAVGWELRPLVPHIRVKQIMFCCLEHLEAWLVTLPYGDERDTNGIAEQQRQNYTTKM